jgi:hypothetical protein
MTLGHLEDLLVSAPGYGAGLYARQVGSWSVNWVGITGSVPVDVSGCGGYGNPLGSMRLTLGASAGLTGSFFE